MTFNGHFALNFVLCRYVWSSEAGAWRPRQARDIPVFPATRRGSPRRRRLPRSCPRQDTGNRPVDFPVPRFSPWQVSDFLAVKPIKFIHFVYTSSIRFELDTFTSVSAIYLAVNINEKRKWWRHRPIYDIHNVWLVSARPGVQRRAKVRFCRVVLLVSKFH